MAAISAQYGVPSLASKFSADLADIYDQYLSSVIPPGDKLLEGWEMDSVRAFKDALGLEDQDAAQVHLEIGRRIFRSRMELGDKDLESGQRREFQKLVFLSTIVFGEQKARFLLPWKRLFQVTDAQVGLAVRDNASKLFKERFSALLPDAAPDRALLAQLREYQLQVQLSDDGAAELVAAAARRRVEAAAARASDVLKNRTRVRDVSAAMEELEALLAYNRELKALAAAPEGLPPGVGPVSLFGGAFEADAKMGELRDLFRMFAAENIKGGELSASAQAALGELRACFGLGAREADTIVADVTLKVYRMTLRKALAEGQLAAAASPAKFLQQLCDALKFPPPSAEAVNLELFRARLEELVATEVLTDEAEAELQQMRRLLCVPAATDAAARREVCGEVYKRAVKQAMEAGVDGFSLDLRDKCKKVQQAVRLEDDAAVAVIGELARKVWLSFVRDSRNKANRLDAAKELKNIVLFNSAVVTPLVRSVRQGQREAAAAEIAEIMKEAQAAAAQEDAAVAALGGAAGASRVGATRYAGAGRVGAASFSAPGMRAAGADDVSSMGKVEAAMAKEASEAQREVTLANELPQSQRSELYRTFLLYCMTGDQIYAPMGTTITIERDQSEFVRLSQLGEVLGLNQMEISAVHRGLAEQAFRSNASALLKDGLLTSDKKEKLLELQTQLGLPAEVAQKVVAGITSGKMLSNVQAQIATGKLTLEDVEQMAENGADFETVVSAEVRMTLFRQEVERQLTGGSGEFDAPRLLERAPAALKLDGAKVRSEVAKVAAEKKRNQLVQAVSFLRQKDKDAVLRCCANLLACAQAAPGGAALEWPVKEELMDLYSCLVWAGQGSGGRADDLAALLGLSPETQQNLNKVVSAGGFQLEKDKFKESLY